MRIIGDNKINICQYTARSHGVFRDEFLGFVAYAMATVNQALIDSEGEGSLFWKHKEYESSSHFSSAKFLGGLRIKCCSSSCWCCSHGLSTIIK